eukprot:scaffold64486_cov32-Tisochrysis_lutea.AAC.1
MTRPPIQVAPNERVLPRRWWRIATMCAVRLSMKVQPKKNLESHLQPMDRYTPTLIWGDAATLRFPLPRPAPSALLPRPEDIASPCAPHSHVHDHMGRTFRIGGQTSPSSCWSCCAIPIIVLYQS